MDTPPIDTPIVIVALLILSVLISSAILWIRQVQRPSELIPQDKGVAAWPIGWACFGIFLCAMVLAIYWAQKIGLAFFADAEGKIPELTPWLAVVSVLLLQGPMLAVFYLARRFYPGHYAGRLNQVQYSLVESFKKAVPLFIMFLPVIWIATLLWSSFLSGLQNAGVIEEFAPQELVSLFKSGGDWLAITILMLMAVIVAPVVEEIIFRGCIYRFLKSQTTLLGAQAISGIVFALLHGNLLSFVPLIVVGIILARIYEKTGNLLVAIWFHGFFNAFSLCVLFITGMSDNLPPT